MVIFQRGDGRADKGHIVGINVVYRPVKVQPDIIDVPLVTVAAPTHNVSAGPGVLIQAGVVAEAELEVVTKILCVGNGNHHLLEILHQMKISHYASGNDPSDYLSFRELRCFYSFVQSV